MVTPNSAKNGNFIIINPKNSNIIVNNNNISLNNSDANDNKNESNSDILKNILKCALCDNIEIVALSNCGCPLCKNDNDLITKKIVLCPTHKKELKRGIQFPKKKEEIITHLDDKGQQTVEKVCPVCKVSPGTCSFNCKCGAVVCAKCFNDIMNVYNFKRCPICKMEYKPLPKKKKAKKQKNKK